MQDKRFEGCAVQPCASVDIHPVTSPATGVTANVVGRRTPASGARTGSGDAGRFSGLDARVATRSTRRGAFAGFLRIVCQTAPAPKPSTPVPRRA